MGFVNVDMKNFDGYGDFGRSRFRSITRAISAPIRTVTKVALAPVKMVAKPLSKVTTPLLRPFTKIPVLGKGIAAVGGATGLMRMKPAVIADEASGQPTTVYQDENGNYITEAEYNRLSAEVANQQAVPATRSEGMPEFNRWRTRPAFRPMQIQPQTVVDSLPNGMPSSPGPEGAAMQQQSPTAFMEKVTAMRNGSKADQQAMQEALPDIESAPGSAEEVDTSWAQPFLTKDHLKGEIAVDTFGRYPVRRRKQIGLAERRREMRSNMSGFGGINFVGGARPLQYGPVTFRGFDDVTGQWTPDAPAASGGGFLQSITDLATRAKKTAAEARAASSAIRDIARAGRAKPAVPALPGAPIARPNTIMGMPAMAVYTGAGLLIAGSVAYFAFKKR